jgi:hypothetical protein
VRGVLCFLGSRDRGIATQAYEATLVSDDTPVDRFLAGDTTASGTTASAADLWALVPAVGQNGNVAPLQTFSELLQGIGRDGSRAHTLQQVCVP